MSQPNGLPVNVDKFDTIGTHDFADTSSWPTTNDSTWTLEPDSGKAIRINRCQVDFSEDIEVHSGGQLLVEYFVDGNETPVKTVTYDSINTWMNRSATKKRIENSTIGNTMQYDICFACEPVLWSSTGTDGNGETKINKMTVRIADDIPYKKSSDSQVTAQIARARYFIEVYTDPDV